MPLRRRRRTPENPDPRKRKGKDSGLPAGRFCIGENRYMRKRTEGVSAFLLERYVL